MYIYDNWLCLLYLLQQKIFLAGGLIIQLNWWILLEMKKTMFNQKFQQMNNLSKFFPAMEFKLLLHLVLCRIEWYCIDIKFRLRLMRQQHERWKYVIIVLGCFFLLTIVLSFSFCIRHSFVKYKVWVNIAKFEACLKES